MRRAALLLALIAGLVSSLPTPAMAAGGKEKRFSVFCDLSHTAQVDPIVSPGETSAHLHEFFGNRGTSSDPDFEAMLDNGTTCQFSGDTAGYWVPTLRRADGTRVPPTHVLVYYRHTRSGPVSPHPADFKAVSFDAKWMCLDSQLFSTPPNCDTSDRKFRDVGLRIVFKPVKLADGSFTPRIAMNLRFAIKDARNTTLDTGVAPHGDFWNTWNQDAYRTLVRRCLGDPNGPWAGYTAAQWEARCSKVTDAKFALGD